MNNVAIRVENLGKTFRIGARQERYQTFRDSLTRAVTSSFHRAAAVLRGHASEIDTDEIWALQDVSLEVQRGEVVGIIGSNGAGKSTLLKILSRITDPTRGRVSIKGRVGSLLEVGTGFHPELTGRENIYLNGAILGMRRTEINKKFEEIVGFAELEKFLDTAVKHYSSGMYTRLAFAVAAHLETEILLVDEVLAVGDASFQRKCLGKMSAVAKEGRTVVFVSHNTAAILSLCGRATWLNAGKVRDDGETSAVVQRYLKSMSATEGLPLQQRTDRKGDGSARLVSLRIEGANDDHVIRPGSRWKIILGYHSEQPLKRADFCLSVYDYMLGCRIFELDSEVTGGLTESLPAEGTVTCLTDPVDLSPGRCYVNATLMRNGVLADYIPHAVSFDVETADIYGTGKTPSRNHVINVIKHQWFAETARTDYGSKEDDMRVGFLACAKFHDAILQPIHETLRHKHWCLYTANREALFDFQPHVVIMGEAIFGELRPRLPNTLFVHTRHGLASKRVAYQGANECDYLCVTSEFMRDWYQQGGSKPRGDFWVIGYVGMDPLFRGDTPALPFAHRLGQKTVLYAPTFNRPLSSAAMLGDRLVELIRGSRQDISIIIKPHPLIAKQSPIWMETWQRLVDTQKDVHLVANADDDVMPYLRAADALITDASSVQLYYLAVDRPMILINNPDRFDCEYFDPRGFEWAWRDMGEQIENVEELPAAVNTALSDPRSNSDRRAHYRKLLFDDLTDGKAVERLCQKVEALAAVVPSDHLSYLASVPAARLAARKVKWAARRAVQGITWS